MKGVVVELNNLNSKKELNGKRGYIKTISATDAQKYYVNLDDVCVKIDNKFLNKVYCLGIPKEYWYSTTTTSEIWKQDVIYSVNSSVFYVFFSTIESKTTYFLVNYKVLMNAFEKITTEPLLRIYGMTTSQKDTNIVFDQCCINMDVSVPWFVDLSSNLFLELISRYESFGNDQEALRRMNINDVMNENSGSE
tara:strand:- start:146 stop:724 length:579 start_codon:yes stop_codon:yes gene_type:complete